jgi:hypothetical protein
MGMVVMIERPWRCEVTGNPVGTDTRMVGAPPCDCQGCRAEATITSLSAERDRANESLREVQFVFGQTAGALERSEAEATDLRRKLEEATRDRDEKIARALNQADIEAERAGNALNDLEASERKLEEARKALEPFSSCYEFLQKHPGELPNVTMLQWRLAKECVQGTSE